MSGGNERQPRNPHVPSLKDHSWVPSSVLFCSGLFRLVRLKGYISLCPVMDISFFMLNLEACQRESVMALEGISSLEYQHPKGCNPLRLKGKSGLIFSTPPSLMTPLETPTLACSYHLTCLSLIPLCPAQSSMDIGTEHLSQAWRETFIALSFLSQVWLVLSHSSPSCFVSAPLRLWGHCLRYH